MPIFMAKVEAQSRRPLQYVAGVADTEVQFKETVRDQFHCQFNHPHDAERFAQIIDSSTDGDYIVFAEHDAE